MSADTADTSSGDVVSSRRSRQAVGLAWTIAALCCAVSAFVAIRYAGQRPMDQFSFRQTQTALTAYWLVKNGFSLAYETPVAGAPWAIPFEFPIYQWIVALVSRTRGTGLDATARIVSYVFLLGCVFPVRALTRRLQLPPLVFPIFCILLFSSPTYLYWGRTFMIETTALFFTVCAVRYFIDLLEAPPTWGRRVLFVVCMSLGLLQKITTALPVLVVLLVVFAVVRMRGHRTDGRWRITRSDCVEAAIGFGIPLAIGGAWTIYSDEVKQLNALGQQLTSSALRSWNFGTLRQRLTEPLYRFVIEDRIFRKNLAGVFGMLLMGIAATQRWASRPAWLFWISLALGLLPILAFSNLHLVHDYYECGNLIFFLFALAVAIGDLLAPHIKSIPILGITLIFIVSRNYASFQSDYLRWTRAVYSDANDTEMAISTVVARHVPPGKIFVAFDFDWTSSLAYLSERRAFMMSPLFKRVEEARGDPSRFVDPSLLGAVVACPKSELRLRQLADWATHDRVWKVGLVDNCYVAAPETAAGATAIEPATARCDATDIAVLPARESPTMRVVRLRLPPANPGSVEASYATGPSPTDLHEMLDVTRRSPRVGIDRDDEPGREFTRLVDGGDDASPRVYRRTATRVDECRVATSAGTP